MTASAISSSTRYINKGVTKCYWVTSISDISAPTAVELDAGTDLSPEIMDINGWTIETESVDTPDLANTFTGNIPGSTSAGDSSITLYADLGGTDVRDLLATGTNGYIVWMDGGYTAGRNMDVFPVRVGSRAMNRTLDNDPATVEVSFYVTSAPAEGVTVPS